MPTFGNGRQASIILTVSGVLWLGVAGYAATVADASRPKGESRTSEPTMNAPAPVEDGRPAEAHAPEAHAAIVRRVEAVMREKHLYRDPDLTLERLARRAGISAWQISAALNRVHGRNVSQIVNGFRVEKTWLVEPVDPFEGGELDDLEGAPGSAALDHLGLEQADHRLGERVVVQISDTADGGFDAGLGEAFGLANAHILRSSAQMAYEPATCEGSSLMKGLLQRIEDEVRPGNA